GHLPFQGCGVRILVVVTNVHDGNLHDRRHVDSFMPIAPAGSSIPKKTNGYAIFVAHLEGHADAGRDRNVIAKHADEGDKVVLHIAHMHVPVTTTRCPGFTCHVLSQNGSNRHPSNQERSHVPMRWAGDILFAEIDATTNRDRFLASANVHSADDLSLTVEL